MCVSRSSAGREGAKRTRSLAMPLLSILMCPLAFPCACTAADPAAGSTRSVDNPGCNVDLTDCNRQLLDGVASVAWRSSLRQALHASLHRALPRHLSYVIHLLRMRFVRPLQ